MSKFSNSASKLVVAAVASAAWSLLLFTVASISFFSSSSSSEKGLDDFLTGVAAALGDEGGDFGFVLDFRLDFLDFLATTSSSPGCSSPEDDLGVLDLRLIGLDFLVVCGFDTSSSSEEENGLDDVFVRNNLVDEWGDAGVAVGGAGTGGAGVTVLSTAAAGVVSVDVSGTASSLSLSSNGLVVVVMLMGTAAQQLSTISLKSVPLQDMEMGSVVVVVVCDKTRKSLAVVSWVLSLFDMYIGQSQSD